MTDEKDSRSLDLCAVGLGQGGGNLAAEWRRRGYRSLLVNTARADLKALSHHDGLDVPDDCVLHIGLEGSEGAGKDPEYGMACVRAHGDEVRQAVERQLAGADGILLCAGLGGGTGSAVPELVRVLAPLDVPLLTVTTLPSGAESGIAKVNAVKTTNALISAELSGRVFIDNDRLVGTFADVDLVSWYPSVNARVLAPLDELNRLNRRDDLWSIRSFDGEDLRKVLLSGGVLQTHVTRLEEGRALDSAYLVDVVTECVSGGNHLAQGLELPQVAYLALVVVGPQKALQGTPMHVFEDAIRQLKQQTGGGAVYEGLYVAPDDAPLKAYVLSASLALPSRITSLLGDARSEGAELAKKIRADLPSLEVSPLEGLALFRSPSRRPAADRPQAPQPRALGEQMGEVEDIVRPRTRKLDLPEEGASERSDNSDAYRPRVGTGRYDENEEAVLEPTQVKASDALSGDSALPRVGTGRRDADLADLRAEAPEPTLFVAGDELQQRETRPYDASSVAARVMARAGGAWAETPASPLVEPESSALLSSAPSAPVHESVQEEEPAVEDGAPPSGVPAPITVLRSAPRLQTSSRAALLAPESPREARVPQEYDLADEAAGFEGSLTNPDGQALDVSAEMRRIIDDSEEGPATRTDARPALPLETGAMLSSVIEGSSMELQSVYEDLVDRFRQAADKRDKERVMRRLIDDAAADDVEVRVLAVWAMVKLEDGGFRRALTRCKTDGNPEISRLAEAGLEKIEAQGA